MNNVFVKPILSFSIIATTVLGPVAGKKTKKCFTGLRYLFRDPDFDKLFSKDQPSTDDCVISTLASARDWTFAEAAAAVLDVSAGTGVKLLGKLLIEHGYVMTVSQVEAMVEATECGEGTGMCIDGYGNFFFVKTEDQENPVSVAYMRCDTRWHALAVELAYFFHWPVDCRFLVRNLDIEKLVL